MFIYNITVKVDWSVQNEWLKWMQEEEILAMLSTGIFQRHQLVRLLQIDDSEGPTYAVQYYAEALSDVNEWLAGPASLQAEKTARKWGDRIISFATIMEVV